MQQHRDTTHQNYTTLVETTKHILPTVYFDVAATHDVKSQHDIQTLYSQDMCIHTELEMNTRYISQCKTNLGTTHEFGSRGTIHEFRSWGTTHEFGSWGTTHEDWFGARPKARPHARYYPRCLAARSHARYYPRCLGTRPLARYYPRCLAARSHARYYPRCLGAKSQAGCYPQCFGAKSHARYYPQCVGARLFTTSLFTSTDANVLLSHAIPNAPTEAQSDTAVLLTRAGPASGRSTAACIHTASQEELDPTGCLDFDCCICSLCCNLFLILPTMFWSETTRKILPTMICSGPQCFGARPHA